MNDRMDQSKDHPTADSRANLLFLLQRLAKQTQAQAITCKNSESSITDEQVGEYKRNGGMI